MHGNEHKTNQQDLMQDTRFQREIWGKEEEQQGSGEGMDEADSLLFGKMQERG